MKTKLFILLTITAAAAVFFFACQKTESVKKINTSADNVALKGFDTVAYFASRRAVQGSPQLSVVWNGAKWYFSSEENMEKFKAAPENYAPQFGGYCSYAVAHGYTADIDPEAWKIVDGKLYLNYNRTVQALWERNEENFIRDGVENWGKFQIEMPAHKGGN